MKLTFLLSMLLSSMASAGPLSPECKVLAKKFLIRGDVESLRVGARLWDMDKLAKVALKDPRKYCHQELFSSALADDRDYWTYIGRKYQCMPLDSDVLGNAKPKTCSDEKWKQLNENFNYIQLQTKNMSRLIDASVAKDEPVALERTSVDVPKTLSTSAEATVCQDCETAKNNMAEASLTAATAVVATSAQVTNTCPGIKWAEWQSSDFAGCPKGILNGFSKVIEDMVMSLKSFTPTTAIAMISALKDLAVALARDFQGTLARFFDATAFYVNSTTEKIKCANNQEVATFICTEFPRRGAEFVLAFLTRGALGSTHLAEFSQFIVREVQKVGQATKAVLQNPLPLTAEVAVARSATGSAVAAAPRAQLAIEHTPSPTVVTPKVDPEMAARAQRREEAAAKLQARRAEMYERQKSIDGVLKVPKNASPEAVLGLSENGLTMSVIRERYSKLLQQVSYDQIQGTLNGGKVPENVARKSAQAQQRVQEAYNALKLKYDN